MPPQGDSMARLSIISLVGCVVIASGPWRAQDKIAITVEGGKQDLKNVPICVPLSLTEKQVGLAASFSPDRVGTVEVEQVHGQIATPGIMTETIPPSAKGLV